jgi:DNA topoisomerase-3
LWLDCDREGENICFEVIDIIKEDNPGIRIKRARFSALTQKDVRNSLDNLEEPDENIANGVDIRMRIDLLLGATFTRLQTLKFRDIFLTGKSGILSYGPCQFPTLNFIVERADKVGSFIPENFYTLELKVNKDKAEVKFNWNRNRLFDRDVVTTLQEKAIEGGKKATVVKVMTQQVNRFRPVPLNTVELQKLASKKLKMSSHITMSVADKLYQKGYISYPRTETQRYSFNQNLKKIVETLSNGSSFGFNKYAKGLLKHAIKARIGKLDDKAHPPIHPVKLMDSSAFDKYEKSVYELICIHFLASVSQDAKAEETNVEVNYGDELFEARGLNISEKGYLEIYKYDNWVDSEIPQFKEGEVLKVVGLDTVESSTQKPSFLSESELISLMDKYGIGTDATIHDHIKNVKDRCYAVQAGGVLKPTLSGLSLIKAYSHIGIDIQKPYLRAAMERDIAAVCKGKKEYNATFEEMRDEMKGLFKNVIENVDKMKKFLVKFVKDNDNYEQEVNIKLHTTASSFPTVVSNKTPKGSEEKNSTTANERNASNKNNPSNDVKYKGGDGSKSGDNFNGKEIGIGCPKCKSPLVIRFSEKYKNYFISCSNFPSCKHIISLKYTNEITQLKIACKGCKTKMSYKLDSPKATYYSCLSTCLEKNEHDFLKSCYDKKFKSDAIKQFSAIKSKTTKANEVKDDTSKAAPKTCSVCGVKGRHPTGSTCSGKSTKKKKPSTKSGMKNEGDFIP